MEDSQTIITTSDDNLEGSNQYIRINNRKKKTEQSYNSINLLDIIFLLMLTLLLLLVSIDRYQNSSSKNNNMIDNWKSDMKQYEYVKSEKGILFQLDYSPSEIIVPNRTHEPALKQINLPFLHRFDQIAQQKAQFSQILFNAWLNQSLQYAFQAEYYILHTKYNLDQPILQKNLCILSPYRNFLNNPTQSYLYLKSLNAQNYTNYIVYLIDDTSTDDSIDFILNQTKQKFPRLNNRLKIIKNHNNIGALGNRDIVTRNHCKKQDIVVDIDGDDALIGKQVFNLVNRLYQNEDNWLVYFNYLTIRGKEDLNIRLVDLNSKMKPGISKAIRQITFDTNSYRTQISEWVTSQLRTYRQELYVKIPLTHVIERGTRKYLLKASDRFSMYALVELAGSRHTKFVQQFVYFYFEPNFIALTARKCGAAIMIYNEAKARILPPLIPLKKLDAPAQITQNHKIPDNIAKYYIKRQKQYYYCLRNQYKKN